MFTKSRAALKVAVAGTLLAGITSAAQADNIIQTDFVSTGSQQSIDGTTLGLTVNQPGGAWKFGAGWDWSQPVIAATWDAHQNVVAMQEEQVIVGIPINSAGLYVKPTSFTISTLVYPGDSNHPGSSTGLGFWSAIAGQDNSIDSRTNYTGLILNAGTGTLQVYANGAYQGSPVDITALVPDPGVVLNAGGTPVNVALNYNWAYTLSYHVDTSTGAISNVLINGNAVSGLSSPAFTDAATTFAGFMTNNGGRGFFGDFVVATVVPEPATLGLLALGGIAMIGRKQRKA